MNSLYHKLFLYKYNYSIYQNTTSKNLNTNSETYCMIPTKLDFLALFEPLTCTEYNVTPFFIGGYLQKYSGYSQ